MRRWNGWGDDGIDVPLPDAAHAFLNDAVGTPTPPVSTPPTYTPPTTPDPPVITSYPRTLSGN